MIIINNINYEKNNQKNNNNNNNKFNCLIAFKRRYLYFINKLILFLDTQYTGTTHL